MVWQSTPVFLPGESPWTEGPGGLRPWGWKELDMTERLSTAQIVDLQCCVSFWCVAKWLHHTHSHTHITYILFQILFHYRLVQDIEYSSLRYAVGLTVPDFLDEETEARNDEVCPRHPAWLAWLCTQVCLIQMAVPSPTLQIPTNHLDI